MGIRKIIAVIGLSFAAATVQAVPRIVGEPRAPAAFGTPLPWSLGVPPSISDVGDFITNVNSKTIQIDSAVVSDTPTSLTVSNVTVAGLTGVTNTLFLNTSGTNVPLHVISSMTISNAGVLSITNSSLQVDGGSGGIFLMMGTMKVLNGSRVQPKTPSLPTTQSCNLPSEPTWGPWPFRAA